MGGTVGIDNPLTSRGLVQSSGTCPYHANSGDDCGFVGITQQQCEDRGCCWDPTSANMLCYPRGPAVGNEHAVTTTSAATMGNANSITSRRPVQGSGTCPHHANSGDDCGLIGIT